MLTETNTIKISQILGITPSVLDYQLTYDGSSLTAAVENK